MPPFLKSTDRDCPLCGAVLFRNTVTGFLVCLNPRRPGEPGYSPLSTRFGEPICSYSVCEKRSIK